VHFPISTKKTTTPDEHVNPTAHVTTWDELANDDNDVRVVGYGDVRTMNGETVAVQELDINGQRVAIIDVDRDGIGDYVMTDLNHNQQMDDGEVIDLQTGEALTFTNNESTADQALADDDAPDVDLPIL